jgi:hypothetical protein
MAASIDAQPVAQAHGKKQLLQTRASSLRWHLCDALAASKAWDFFFFFFEKAKHGSYVQARNKKELQVFVYKFSYIKHKLGPIYISVLL